MALTGCGMVPTLTPHLPCRARIASPSVGVKDYPISFYSQVLSFSHLPGSMLNHHNQQLLFTKGLPSTFALMTSFNIYSDHADEHTDSEAAGQR